MATSATDMPTVANWPTRMGHASCHSAAISVAMRAFREPGMFWMGGVDMRLPFYESGLCYIKLDALTIIA